MASTSVIDQNTSVEQYRQPKRLIRMQLRTPLTLSHVLNCAPLNIGRHVLAGMVQITISDQGHIQPRKSTILNKLSEIRIREDQTCRKDVVGQHGAERMRDFGVGTDHLFACRLEEELGTGRSAGFEVDDGSNCVARLVLRDVEMRSVLQALFTVVEPACKDK